jgi:hypothetical protein
MNVDDDSFWRKHLKEVSEHEKFILKNWNRAFLDRPFQAFIIDPIKLILWSNFITAFIWQSLRIFRWFVFYPTMPKPKSPASFITDTTLEAIQPQIKKFEERIGLEDLIKLTDPKGQAQAHMANIVIRFMCGLLFLILVLFVGMLWLLTTKLTSHFIWKPVLTYFGLNLF